MAYADVGAKALSGKTGHLYCRATSLARRNEPSVPWRCFHVTTIVVVMV